MTPVIIAKKKLIRLLGIRKPQQTAIFTKGIHPIAIVRSTVHNNLKYFKNKGVTDLHIYAHNAKYDCHSSDKGILSCLIRQNRCELDGSMIFITGEFYGMKVKIVDSHKFIAANSKIHQKCSNSEI
jgi:hypothetical protein